MLLLPVDIRPQPLIQRRREEDLIRARIRSHRKWERRRKRLLFLALVTGRRVVSRERRFTSTPSRAC
ncbi:hypothetical protein [Pseudoruegeria sp. HB172150]|uniref:hypothetical protein n=1 Tax=Pseudoruegeria sp. HB172150 TaxID=2721164 RepID=UPI001557871D|nr:hypothetical protein [Pseudoruegeria sp. HB172150]